MKKILIFILFVCATAGALQGQTNTDITRGQLWGQFAFKSKLHKSGFGIDAEYGFKYNFSFSQSVNGTETNTETQSLWLNEFFIGPMWSGTLAKNLSLSSSLMYRPMGFYLAGDKASDPDPYWLHTIYWPTEIKYKLPFLTISYRLALWNWFSASYKQSGVDKESDNEFIMRHFIDLIYPLPFYKKLKLELGYEIFHLTTPEKDVQQGFFKHHVLGGVVYKPVKALTVKLGYWYQMTYPTESASMDKDVFDHHIKLTVSYFLDMTK